MELKKLAIAGGVASNFALRAANGGRHVRKEESNFTILLRFSARIMRL